MARLRRNTDENAFVYTEVSGLKRVKKYCGGDFLCLLVNAHVYYFTPKTLRTVMNKAGYDLVEENEIIYSLFLNTCNSNGKNYENDYAFQL